MPSWWPSDTVLHSFGPNEDPDNDELMPQLWRAPEVVKSLEDGEPLPRRSWQAADIYSFGWCATRYWVGRFQRWGWRRPSFTMIPIMTPTLWVGPEPDQTFLPTFLRLCRTSWTDAGIRIRILAQALQTLFILWRVFSTTNLRVLACSSTLCELAARLCISEPTESDLLELEQLVVSHTSLNQSPDIEIKGAKHLHWAFGFASTAKNFFRKCWKTVQQAGESELMWTLSLSSYIQSWSLLVLMRNHGRLLRPHSSRNLFFARFWWTLGNAITGSSMRKKFKVREDTSPTFNDKLSILRAGVYQNLLWDESTTSFASLFWERSHVGTSVLATIDDIIQRNFNDVNEVERLRLSIRKDPNKHIFKGGIVKHVTSYSLGTVEPKSNALVPLLYLRCLLYWLFGATKICSSSLDSEYLASVKSSWVTWQLWSMASKGILFCLLGLAYGWTRGCSVCGILWCCDKDLVGHVTVIQILDSNGAFSISTNGQDQT